MASLNLYPSKIKQFAIIGAIFLLFPIDINYYKANQAQIRRGDYSTDSGCDILTSVRGAPIIAVDDAILRYAEYGHLKPKWLRPGNDPYSVRIILKNPIQRNGRTYREVFYTHLMKIHPAIKDKSGIEIKKGQILGWSGTANVPHLHITFYERYGGSYIGAPGQRRDDDEVMMWDEWLPVQLATPETPPEETEEEDGMIYAYQGDRAKAKHFADRLKTEDKYDIKLAMSGQQSNPKRPLIVDVVIYSGEKNGAIKQSYVRLPNNLPLEVTLGPDSNNPNFKVNGRFRVRIESRRTLGIKRPFTAAIVYVNK